MLWCRSLMLALVVACEKPAGTPSWPGPQSAARLPKPGLSEPVYTPGVNTVIWQDNMDQYLSATDMLSKCRVGGYSGITPGACLQGGALDSATMLIAPGRGGSGFAVRTAYQGVSQESHNWFLTGIARSDYTKPLYVQYWFRFIWANSASALSVKWIELTHPDGTRVQFNTHYSAASGRGFVPGMHTAWQVYDGNTTTALNGIQPVGPFLDKIGVDGGLWHRVTYAYLPHSRAGARDGYARMWVDGTKIIDISQATVGVIPRGATYQWCDQSDVDFLYVSAAGAVVATAWPSTQTTTTPPWTLDWDDFLMWQ